MDGNVIVGQSGGPTSVINSSLAGVYKTAIDRGAKKVYGMLHGIKGLLDGQYVDLSEKINSTMDIDLLKRTPSSYLGSCRYKPVSYTHLVLDCGRVREALLSLKRIYMMRL